MIKKPDGIIMAFRIVLKLITKLFSEKRAKLISVADQKLNTHYGTTKRRARLARC